MEKLIIYKIKLKIIIKQCTYKVPFGWFQNCLMKLNYINKNFNNFKQNFAKEYKKLKKIKKLIGWDYTNGSLKEYNKLTMD